MVKKNHVLAKFKVKNCDRNKMMKGTFTFF